MCAPSETSFCFHTLLCLVIEHKSSLFSELDLENDKIFLSKRLDLIQKLRLKISQKLEKLYSKQ